MRVFEVTLFDEVHRIEELLQLLQDMASVLQDVTRYSQSDSALTDQPKPAIEVSRSGYSSVCLNASSRLFDLNSALLHQLEAAVRFQAIKRKMPIRIRDVGFRPESYGAGQRAQFSSALLDAPFPANVAWRQGGMSLILNFNAELALDEVKTYDARLAVWAKWTTWGAYTANLSIGEEDPDVGIYLDPPCVGRDFIEWSLVCSAVPSEALQTLIAMVVRLERGQRRIAELSIG
jgi:hypothetical protein